MDAQAVFDLSQYHNLHQVSYVQDKNQIFTHTRTHARTHIHFNCAEVIYYVGVPGYLLIQAKVQKAVVGVGTSTDKVLVVIPVLIVAAFTAWPLHCWPYYCLRSQGMDGEQYSSRYSLGD